MDRRTRKVASWLKGRPLTPPIVLPGCRQELVMTMQAVARIPVHMRRSYPVVVRVEGARERRKSWKKYVSQPKMGVKQKLMY
jgi:hypothetical protein